MNINGFELKVQCVTFVMTYEELSDIIRKMLFNELGVNITPWIYADEESLSVAIDLTDDESLSEESTDILCENGYQIQEHFEMTKRILSKLFMEKGLSNISAEGIPETDKILVHVPEEIYTSWQDANAIVDLVLGCETADLNKDEEVTF